MNHSVCSGKQHHQGDSTPNLYTSSTGIIITLVSWNALALSVLETLYLRAIDDKIYLDQPCFM